MVSCPSSCWLQGWLPQTLWCQGVPGATKGVNHVGCGREPERKLHALLERVPLHTLLMVCTERWVTCVPGAEGTLGRMGTGAACILGEWVLGRAYVEPRPSSQP